MHDKTKAKILIVGGHLTPALAILSKLQTVGFKNLVWIGIKYSQTFSKVESAEYKTIRSKGIRFYALQAGKIWRKWTQATFFKGLLNLILIPVGFIQALIILLKEKPALILSFGGYLALPVVIAGWLLRIKSITHEQTITSGLSNRIISKFANKILVSWPSSVKYYPTNKTVLTGNPIREEVLKVTTNNFNFANKLPVIYITGGNQGSNTINWRLYEFLPQLLSQANIIHQTGNSTLTNDLDKAKKVAASLPAELQQRYIFAANFFGPEIGEILAKAQLIVSRSGANTVAEIIALNKYALFIPIPWSSQNEQQLNAEFAMHNNNAEILQQYDAMKPQELFDAILKALEQAKKPRAMNRQIQNEADEKILQQIYSLL